MVRRRVNLAQAVCAVYSLSRPTGASRAEIVRFCVHRFGSVRDPRGFDRVLERAVDQGLLKVFRRRYRLAKLTNSILWAGGKKKEKDCASRSGEGNRRVKRSVSKKTKRTSGSKTGRNVVERISSFYKLWCKSRGRKVPQMDRKNRKQDGARKRTFVKKERHQRSRSPLRRQGSGTRFRKHCKTRTGKSEHHRKRQDVKNSLRSRREHSKYSSRKPSTQNHKTSRSSNNSTRSHARSDFHHQVLQQTKNAVLHSKSWDRLNETRQKSQKENNRLLKNSQLVQKILTGSHGPSWDDLNHKLRRMKEAKSLSEVDGAGDLEPRRSHTTTRSHRGSTRHE